MSDVAGSGPVVSSIDAVRDAAHVRRVFGEPYEVGDVTVIPVAKVGGGGGGGGGGEQAASDDINGGFGLGWGVSASPVGVFVVREGDVRWEPAVDRNRAAFLATITTLAALYTARRIVRLIFGR